VIDQPPVRDENATIAATVNTPDESASADGRPAITSDSTFAANGRFESPDNFPHILRHPILCGKWLVEVVFGAMTMWLLLAVIAAVPVGNLLALGYLLEAEGRVARSGKLRHAMFLLPAAARLGSIIIGLVIWLAPVWLLAGAVRDAGLIAPDGRATWMWRFALLAATVLVGSHLLLALSRGGGPGCFFRPVKNVRWLIGQLRAGTYWPTAHAAVRDFVRAWRVPHHLWLGTVGFVATAAWLAIPTMLYAALHDSANTWQWLATVAGGACLVPVLSWLPILQAQFAAEPRVGAMFDLRAARELIRNAPIAWLLATTALFALSVPLFLYSFHLKMHLPPHRGIIDLTFISLGSAFAARAFLGWAVHRSGRRAAPVPLELHEAGSELKRTMQSGWRPVVRTAVVLITRGVLFVLLGLFVWLMFHTRFTTERNHLLLQHHSLLLPIPLPN